MAHTKAAKKDLRKNKKRFQKNQNKRLEIKYLLKSAEKSFEKKDLDKAKEIISKAYKALDKAVKKGVIKKNTSRRKKSRLMKKYNFVSKK